MFRLRMIGKIVRQAGLGHITVVFLILFFACAGLLMVSEANDGISFGDALWICFQTVTTIGFGDVPTNTLAARVVLVILSVVSVFYLAVITGVVVAYCNQLVQMHTKESIAHFADQLEHLEELDREQLAEISRRVRTFTGKPRK